MTGPDLLSVAQLDGYAALLEAIGAPLSKQWRPGATDQDIASVEAQLGFTLAPEIRTLWQWRTPPPPEVFEWQFGVKYSLLPPTDALALRRERSEVLYGFAAIPERFVPILNMAHHFVILADSTSGSGPSQAFDYSFEDGQGWIVAPSLGSLIAHWADLIQTGRLTMDGSTMRRAQGQPSFPINAR